MKQIFSLKLPERKHSCPSTFINISPFEGVTLAGRKFGSSLVPPYLFFYDLDKTFGCMFEKKKWGKKKPFPAAEGKENTIKPHRLLSFHVSLSPSGGLISSD